MAFNESKEAMTEPTPTENPCNHDLADRETACADGYCPLCLAQALRRERETVNELEAKKQVLLQAFPPDALESHRELDALKDRVVEAAKTQLLSPGMISPALREALSALEAREKETKT